MNNWNQFHSPSHPSPFDTLTSQSGHQMIDVIHQSVEIFIQQACLVMCAFYSHQIRTFTCFKKTA